MWHSYANRNVLFFIKVAGKTIKSPSEKFITLCDGMTKEYLIRKNVEIKW